MIPFFIAHARQLDFFEIVSVCYDNHRMGRCVCIMDESTRFSRMPTATASTVRKTASRKPRARKAAAKKPQVSKVTVTSFKGGKVVEKVTTLKRPSTARLISGDRYLKDIQTRWAIHNYEIQELGRDLRKGFEFVRPYHAQAVKTVKAWTV